MDQLLADQLAVAQADYLRRAAANIQADDDAHAIPPFMGNIIA
jgi:hypothetical protein